MNTWRPQPRICIKSLGLHWLAGRLLAAEVYDDAGRVKGVRPLGGSVEFGETARDAVIREFKEELGAEIAITGEPVFIENIFVHEGCPGHEIVVLFEVLLLSEDFEGKNCLTFCEDNGVVCVARWFDIRELDVPGGPELYPVGLKAHLQRLGK